MAGRSAMFGMFIDALHVISSIRTVRYVSLFHCSLPRSHAVQSCCLRFTFCALRRLRPCCTGRGAPSPNAEQTARTSDGGSPARWA